MNESAKPTKTKCILYTSIFIVGTGMFFVTTVGPLSDPAMSWDEAMLGLVPGALLMIVGHFLHMSALGKKREIQRQAFLWSLGATVFMIGLGAALVIGGGEKANSAERQLEYSREKQRSPMNSHGDGGLNDTRLIERNIEHYEMAENVGYITLAASFLFFLSTGVAFRRGRVGPQV